MKSHGPDCSKRANLIEFNVLSLYLSKGLLLPYWVTAFLVFTSVAFADETTFEPSLIIDEYVTASIAQQSKLAGASMEVEIQAEVPKLHKAGRLRALRRISSLGRITYDALRFEGDRSIKRDVIVRYLTAEAEAFKSGASDLGVTPANYKFKFKGLAEK